MLAVLTYWSLDWRGRERCTDKCAGKRKTDQHDLGAKITFWRNSGVGISLKGPSAQGLPDGGIVELVRSEGERDASHGRARGRPYEGRLFCGWRVPWGRSTDDVRVAGPTRCGWAKRGRWDDIVVWINYCAESLT